LSLTSVREVSIEDGTAVSAFSRMNNGRA